MAINQSFCIPCFTDKVTIPFGDLFPAAREIGYSATEFWARGMFDDWEATIDEAMSAGLSIASFSGHESLPDGLSDPENHDRIESELHDSIDIAARYGVPGLIVFSGNRKSTEQSDYDGMVNCAVGLRRIVAYAEEKEINLNMELLNSRRNHPGYLSDHTDWGVALCEMVDSPRMKLLYDIYHMQIMEGDIITRIRKNIAHIGHFHTAGNPARLDMDDTQELNYRGICKAISDTGYSLFVGHEFRPKSDPIEALRSAFEICDQ